MLPPALAPLRGCSPQPVPTRAMLTGSFGCQTGTYLLLTQDDDTLGPDGVPGGQVLASSPLFTILVRRPLAVPGGPCHTDVVPGLVLQTQWQLGNL